MRGWLVSEHGVARITHDANSRVEQVLRGPGDVVRAGDALTVLTRERFTDDGRTMFEAVQHELDRQIESVQRRVQLLTEETDLEHDAIALQLAGIEKERRAVDSQRREQLLRIDSASARVAGLARAARGGAVADWELMRHKDELAELQQNLARLQQSEFSLEREQADLEARLLRLPVEAQRAVESLQAQQSRLHQQVTEARVDRRIVLKAPIPGKVASVEVAAGAAVTPRQLLATILPDKLRLVAEVYVPSRAVGFVREGQPVRLKYDAFPHQQFGAFEGTVISVSDFVLLPSEIPQTFVVREATFKVRIAIEESTVEVAGAAARLRPGMLLGADIILERRLLADWLLQPLRLRYRDAA